MITDSVQQGRSVYAADLDGDSDKDVLSASFEDNKIAWYENQVGDSGADSDGFGQQQTITTDAYRAESVYATDLDGDGNPDVLSASAGDDKIAWYENQTGEGGGFSDQKIVTTNAVGAASVFATDFDEDDDNDVLSASQGASGNPGSITWYESTSTTLPVELVDLNASLVDGGETDLGENDPNQTVRLTWQTASETRNAGFEVQRKIASKEPDSWSKIGFVEGAGTTSDPQSYQFTDEGLPYEADALTYRLKQVDTDGTSSYSEKVVVQRSVEQVELLGTYPNPAHSQATVRFAAPSQQEVTIRLYDLRGRRLKTVVDGKKKGRQKTTLHVSSLSSGVYFLRLRAENTTKTQRLTVVR
ncbi:MAG: T9SS type A sorting domain-containing protein [Salinibacter sp.]